MKLEQSLARKITRDIIVSLFIYALPVVLMFGWFYLKGEKPWERKVHNTVQVNRTY